MARRRMYGSATWCISIAVITRVGTPCFLERVLQRQGVDHGGEHAHVIPSHAIHIFGGGGHSTKEVAAADHQSDLDAGPRHFGDFGRQGATRSGSMPKPACPAITSPLSFRRMRLIARPRQAPVTRPLPVQAALRCGRAEYRRP